MNAHASDERRSDSATGILRTPPAGFDPQSVTRPDQRLLTYYTIVAGLTLIAFPITFIPLYLRYVTLRYRFDDEGIGMSVGLLFRKETYLTYRRIQDIHVTRGIIQRWLGLATVAIQTASGSASAEMTIEGVADPDGLRDWLYTRMRGATDQQPEGTAPPPEGAAPQPTSDEALVLLREIRDELQALRERAGGER